MASPRWRFCGFGSGLESNEKRSRCPSPLLNGFGQGRWGSSQLFSPWLCLTRGGLEPFVDQHLNLDQLPLISNVATTALWHDAKS